MSCTEFLSVSNDSYFFFCFSLKMVYLILTKAGLLKSFKDFHVFVMFYRLNESNRSSLWEHLVSRAVTTTLYLMHSSEPGTSDVIGFN